MASRVQGSRPANWVDFLFFLLIGAATGAAALDTYLIATSSSFIGLGLSADITGGIIGGGIGFVSAIFVDFVKNLLFGLRLQLSIGQGPDYLSFVTWPNEDEHGDLSACYVRVKVQNAGRTLARQCRAYLVSVEKRENGRFVETGYVDTIQLAWSAQGAPKHDPERRYLPMDIPNGINQFFDVFATDNRSEELHPQWRVHLMRYDDIFFDWGKLFAYRLTVQVAGDGVKPQTLIFVFRRGASWDDLHVE